MKHLSILEQPSEEATRESARKKDLTEYMSKHYRHPQEDHFATSAEPPIFVVSDGVTLDLETLAKKGQRYPSPSPSGEVAKLFCNAVLENVCCTFDSFDTATLTEIFKEANGAVKLYNDRVGKSDISGNQTELYAATGAFVVIKGNTAYWASICDSFVAHFDKNMKVKFISSGVCEPYAVINGEERMVDHLETGSFRVSSGDRIFVFTDGFEHYVKNTDFQQLFTHWTHDLKGRIAEFSLDMNLKDPDWYGRERTLIAVLA